MFQCSVASLVVITSVMLQCAVDCTRSLFDLVTSVGCTAIYRNMEQSECVVVCEWSYLVHLDHRGHPTSIHKEDMKNNCSHT